MSAIGRVRFEPLPNAHGVTIENEGQAASMLMAAAVCVMIDLATIGRAVNRQDELSVDRV